MIGGSSTINGTYFVRGRPEDFDGWVLLAELYAMRFHDLSSAAQTIGEICDDPKTTPVQFSIALNKLADWHEAVGDRDEALRVLEQICV